MTWVEEGEKCPKNIPNSAFCSGTAATDSTTGAAVGAAPGTGAISWGCSILGDCR